MPISCCVFLVDQYARVPFGQLRFSLLDQVERYEDLLASGSPQADLDQITLDYVTANKLPASPRRQLQRPNDSQCRSDSPSLAPSLNEDNQPIDFTGDSEDSDDSIDASQPQGASDSDSSDASPTAKNAGCRRTRAMTARDKKQSRGSAMPEIDNAELEVDGLKSQLAEYDMTVRQAKSNCAKQTRTLAGKLSGRERDLHEKQLEKHQEVLASALREHEEVTEARTLHRISCAHARAFLDSPMTRCCLRRRLIDGARAGGRQGATGRTRRRGGLELAPAPASEEVGRTAGQAEAAAGGKEEADTPQETYRRRRRRRR